jgi:hypothetical protein
VEEGKKGRREGNYGSKLWKKRRKLRKGGNIDMPGWNYVLATCLNKAHSGLTRVLAIKSQRANGYRAG